MPDEICDNGIDDDQDGLYDAYDPDCICEQASEPLSYISNGDFETISQCCGSMSSPQTTCLENWFVVAATPDYVSASCPNTDFGLFDVEGIPYTGGFIDVGTGNSPDGTATTESMGICLDSPLKACRNYTITFHSIILSILDFSPNQEDLFYTIYGLEHCPDTNFDTSIPFCNLPEYTNAQEILSFNVNNMDRDEWVRFVDSFMPEYDINAIVINVRCNQDVTVTGMPFLFFDNFEFLTGAVECTITGQIEVSGSSCTNDYVLNANTTNGEQYQWFKDSIPVLGATSMVYTPPLSDNGGHYSVLVSNNVECAFLAGVELDAGNNRSTTVFDTICSGQEYYYNLDTLTEEGIYRRSLGVAPDGCELVEELHLYVIPHLDAIFNFSPGLTIPIGSTLTIAPEQDFLNQLESYIWTEDGQELNDSSPNIIRSATQEGSVSYSLSYTHSGGCAQTASFSIEWINIGPQPEDCDNNIDDDQDGLVDTFDDDCPCTANKIDDIQIQDSICTGTSYFFGSTELFTSGVFRDTFINKVNCDSIVTLSLEVILDQIDTIYATISNLESFEFYNESYDQAGWYSFIDENNSSNCDSIHVLRLDIDIPLNVYIPNAISLGSNANNKFYISPNKAIVITDLHIYNRWGNLILKRDRIELIGNDPYIWDGSFKGQKIERGLYVYTLTYSDGSVTEVRTGDITVLE